MRAVDFYTTKTGVKSHFLIFHITFFKNNDVKDEALLYYTIFTRAFLINSLKYTTLGTCSHRMERFDERHSFQND